MVSSTPQDFQTVYEGEIWYLCNVTFGQKSSKLNSRLVYYSQLTFELVPAGFLDLLFRLEQL